MTIGWIQRYLERQKRESFERGFNYAARSLLLHGEEYDELRAQAYGDYELDSFGDPFNQGMREAIARFNDLTRGVGP